MQDKSANTGAWGSSFASLQHQAAHQQTVSERKWSHFLAGSVHRKQPGVCTSIFFNRRAATSRSGESSVAGAECWGSALGKFAASCPPRTAVSRTLTIKEDLV